MPAEAPAESPEFVGSDPSDDVVDILDVLPEVAEAGESVAVEEATSVEVEMIGVPNAVLVIEITVVPQVMVEVPAVGSSMVDGPTARDSAAMLNKSRSGETGKRRGWGKRPRGGGRKKRRNLTRLDILARSD
jgi:hypothetical protein